MKPNGFSVGVVIAILIVISYNIISLLAPGPKQETEDYKLSLLDLDYQPMSPVKKVPDTPFQVYKISSGDQPTEAKLTDYIGKPIILHFWATWCGPCGIELPYYDAFARNDDIVNIALCSGGNAETFEKVNNFYQKHSIKRLPVALDVTGALSRAFAVKGLPTTVFINKDGFEIGRIVGIVDWGDKKVVKLLINLLKN